MIGRAPLGWLGGEMARRYGNQMPLLVKLLDAASDLSVQVHPEPDDPKLAEDEIGKPEAWIITAADEGAGLYLGFQEGVDREDVEACLAEEEALDELMNFVPVEPGDAFVIEAGTVHAIGAGVTLLEPQHVLPGRRGVTYRFWDWNRRYDEEGRLDPEGEPRELHVERSLEVTDWDAPRGEAFVETCRADATTLIEGELSHSRMLETPWFTVERLEGQGAIQLPLGETITALTCLGGKGAIRTSSGDIDIACGQSAVVPAGVEVMEVSAWDIDLFVAHPQIP